MSRSIEKFQKESEIIEEVEAKEKLLLKEENQCLVEDSKKNEMEETKSEELRRDLENLPIPMEQTLNKVTVLGFEDLKLLKIIILSFSIMIFFFFIFLRGNILLKSFANIK